MGGRWGGSKGTGAPTDSAPTAPAEKHLRRPPDLHTEAQRVCKDDGTLASSGNNGLHAACQMRGARNRMK